MKKSYFQSDCNLIYFAFLNSDFAIPFYIWHLAIKNIWGKLLYIFN